MNAARLAGALLAAVVLVTAGCERGPDRSAHSSDATGAPEGVTGGAATASSASASATLDMLPLDPCALLRIEDVQAALGALAGPPFLVLDPNVPPRCRYEARDLRSIDVEVAADAFAGAGAPGTPGRPAEPPRRRHGTLRLPNERVLSGNWDAAWLDGCCRLVAVRGTTTVAVDVQASRVAIDVAARLVDRALDRSGSPLPIDGRSGIEAARARDAFRPTPVAACALLDRREVERVLGGDAAPASSTPESCAYRVRNRAGATRDVHWTVSWRGGYRRFRGAVEATLAARRMRDASERDVPGLPAAPWEYLALGTGRALAVRRDVAITVESDVVLGRAEGAVDLAAALVTRVR